LPFQVEAGINISSLVVTFEIIITTGAGKHYLPSVTELTTNESNPDLGTIAFPVLDRLPSTIHDNKIAQL